MATMHCIVGPELNRQAGVRLLLVGNGTGLRVMLKTVIAKTSDMEIAGELDAEQTAPHICKSLCARRANAVILDVDESARGGTAGAGSRLARGILEDDPEVVVVVMEAMGRRAVVHSAVSVNEIGLSTLLETMRLSRRQPQGAPMKPTTGAGPRHTDEQ